MNDITATNQFDIVNLLNLGVAIAIIVAAALSVISIFMGGIYFILSGGDEAKIKKAIDTIRHAIYGLIITILSVTVIRIVGAIFGFDLLSLISWEKISTLMGQVVDRIVNSGGSSNGSIPDAGSLR